MSITSRLARLSAATLLSSMLAAPAMAQDAPSTILVLDGSGSMWGQIDGVNKIVIAREVMAELVASLPAEQQLGLMSYGHRVKGDCSDIELMIPPGTDRDAIMAAVNGINPKGKTPLSAAVIAAAEALRYTEEAATVILVSDGIETCNLDPCAVGRELEAAGVNFTAHVIGFDVAADPAAQAQLRCLAEETGGLYRDAANADELAGALEEVVVVPEPVAVEARISFEARDGDGGPVITEGLVWTVTTTEGTQLEGDSRATPELMLTDTEGMATVIRLADEAVAERAFTVPFEGGPQTISLTLPPFLPAATLTGPAEAPVGSVVSIGWTGPNLDNDKIELKADAGTDDAHTDRVFTNTGSPVTLTLPVTPGSYEVTYVLHEGNKVLATHAITATEVTASLEAPDVAPVGAELSVTWQGPDADRDYVSIVPTGADHHDKLASAYTGNGNPARFNAPLTPGAYDLIYVLNSNGTRTIARRPITLTEVSASIEAPASAPVASRITVAFTGPGDPRDRLVLTRPDEPAGQPEAFATAYPREGSPTTMTMPIEPGPYELRYMLGGVNGEILVRVPIEATAVGVTLTAPASAPVGSDISVAFTGPGEANDRLVLTRPDERDAQPDEIDVAHPREGSPLELTMPLEPGSYELRYMLGGSHGEILARVPLEATPATATLTPPASVPAGQRFEVAFTGPGLGRDMIVVVPVGGVGSDRIETGRPRDTSPISMGAPDVPGRYELLYMLGGPYGAELARVPLTVE